MGPIASCDSGEIVGELLTSCYIYTCRAPYTEILLTCFVKIKQTQKTGIMMLSDATCKL